MVFQKVGISLLTEDIGSMTTISLIIISSNKVFFEIMKLLFGKIIILIYLDQVHHQDVV